MKLITLREKFKYLGGLILLLAGYIIGWSYGRSQGAKIAAKIKAGIPYDPRWLDPTYWITFSFTGIILVILGFLIIYFSRKSE